MTFLAAHHAELSRRHYVRNARSWNSWFDLSQSRIEGFRDRFGDDFCIILNGSDDADDLYVIPYPIAKRALHADLLDHRRRWVGFVRGEKLRINNAQRKLPLKPFHNAFELLEWFSD
ncbi:MAG: hypothetical protein FJY54_02655 [Betaproteobacteria bacterium]|nr:hypothetical protein [Betaproteobacteria bacterium]